MKKFYENKIVPILFFVFFTGLIYYIFWIVGTFNIFINYFLVVCSIFFVFLNLYKKNTNNYEYEKGSILLSLVLVFFISTSTLVAFVDTQIKEFWINQSVNQLFKFNKDYLDASKLDLDSYVFQNCYNDLRVIISDYKTVSKYDLEVPLDDSGIPIFENIDVDFGDYSGYRFSESIVNNSESSQPGWNWLSSAEKRIEILNEIFKSNALQELNSYQNTLELCTYWQVFYPYNYAKRGFIFSPVMRNLYSNN